MKAINRKTALGRLMNPNEILGFDTPVGDSKKLIVGSEHGTQLLVFGAMRIKRADESLFGGRS